MQCLSRMSMLDPTSITSPVSDTSSATGGHHFVDAERASTLLKGFSVLYENKQFVDIVLVVKDQEFPCHKNVLAASSPFFSTMFNSDLAESNQKEIEIKEMEASTMQLILDYVYTGEVVLTEESVQGVLSAANLFQMIALRNGCADFMMKHVQVTNCIGIYFFARAHNCDSLAAKANEILQSHFNVLCKEQEFIVLPVEQLKEILRDDRLSVTQEETVFESCLAWLNYSIEERKCDLVDIMKCVRFANVSSYYFCDKIDSMSLLQSEPQLRAILDSVKYYHMLNNRQHEIDLNYVPRKGMSYERGIIIMANPYNEDPSRKFNMMELLIPRTSTIHTLCKLPQSVYMPGTCTTEDNQIYLVGGAIRKINYRGPFSTEGVSPNMFLFDKSCRSWQVKAKLNNARTQFSLAVIDGKIVAVGGQNEASRLDSVEMYDQEHNVWSQRAPLPQPARCMTACSYKGSLYVFGGETAKEIVKTAYRYDMSEDSWIELPPMQVPRALAGSVVFKDKIYVIGGNSSVTAKWRKELLPEHTVSSVEVFDPATGQWSVGPELPNALCGAGVEKYGDSIMVIGGEDDKSWMAGTFILRQEGDREFWVEDQELTTVMSTFGCAVGNIPKDLIRDDL